MRNLKKILALALALVMSFSLMATANATSFSDDDQITDTYATAIEVLSGLKVFQGYNNGETFQPQGAITRAEVAAIIYRIVTGDVNDTQVGIYADYNKFDDVASTSWYAGYVNFCANAEYIKGYDARTFGPNDPVTGYQALAMILRALGYDKNGEFTGTNWQVQTAAVGEHRGITKNITAGTLNVPATREVVAEILFQAILVDTVSYTPAFSYQVNDTSIGYETFGLEEITGVVTANECADLENDEPLTEGRTRLDVDGEDYTIDYSTGLDDIGEARNAYVSGKSNTKTVLTIADAGNTVWETSAEDSEITRSDAGMDLSEAQDFVNFDDGWGSSWETEIRINYIIDRDDDSDMTDEEDVVIRRGEILTDTQYDELLDIFTGADERDAWVTVGTKDVSAGNDISDDMTWRAFRDEYLTATEENLNDARTNENGNYVKVIDNDGDGKAEYVLKTVYVMDVVTDIDDDGNYTLAGVYDATVRDHYAEVEIDADDMVTEDELAEDDIVVYAYIDGQYFTNIATMVTESIDRKGIDYKDQTITCGDNTYGQSGIYIDEDTRTYAGAFNNAHLYDNFLFDITDADTEIAYDLYLDNYGYVRAYTLNKHTYGLGLLTDAYYETNRRVDTVLVDMITADTEETEYDVDTTAGNWEYFVDTNEGDSGNRGTWERLDGFFDFVDANNDGIYNNSEVFESFWTNVAAYSDGEDGLVLNDAEDVTNRNMDVSQDALVLDDDSALSTRLFDTLHGDSVYTTTETVYYYVTRVDGDLEIRTWVGYNNAPKGLSLDADVDRAYSVATGTKTVGDASRDYYYYADVVVFEAVSNLEDLYFVYYANTKNINSSDISAAYWLDTIGYNPETEAYESGLEVETTRTGMIRFVPAFYVIDAEGNVEYRVGGTDSSGNYQGYNENNVYAAEASVGRDVYGRNYIRLSDGTYFLTEDVDIYAVTYDGRNPDYDGNSNLWVAFDVENCSVTTGDNVIYVMDGSDVAYVINVDESYWTDSNDVDHYIMNQLYGDILLEQNSPSAYEAAVAQAEAALLNRDVTALNAARTALTDLYTMNDDGSVTTDLTAAQYQNVRDLVDDIDDTLAEIAAANDLEIAKDNAVKAMENAVISAVETADTEDIIGDYDAVRNDDTTDISAAGWGVGYETVKKALATWEGKIRGKGTIAEVNTQAAAIAANYGTLANAYVAAVKADQTADSYKNLAAGKAEAYMTAIKVALKSPINWSGTTTLAAEVESAIDTACSSQAADPEYTLTVTAGDFETGTGVSGTKTVNVEVSVTNSYAGVKCEPVTETIAVTVVW